MPIARYKDLCLDAGDPTLLGSFYGDLLGLELHAQSGGDTYLSGPTPQHTVWINRVPEPKTVKHRVHLDVVARDLAAADRTGATVVDATSYEWVAMTDPEGGELCVFVRDEPAPTGLQHLVVDCAEPATIAAWWHGVLGGDLVHDDRGSSRVERIDGAPFESLDFVPVSEPKTAKNRVHVDVTTTDVAELVDAGAVVLREPSGRIFWTVMADPDGNEFCAFTP